MPDDLVADPVDPTPPLTPPAPTQTKYPWRTVLRSVFQGIVGFAPVFPLIVGASGADETGPAIALGLAVSGGITRIMAVPQVEDFLQKHVPWLAAKPASA